MVLGQTAWLPGTATNCNLCNCFRPQPHRLSEGEDVGYLTGVGDDRQEGR